MTKKKRLFVAINLPEETKDKLRSFQEQWREFPARWVRPENIHLTLNFLGYIGEENTPTIIETLTAAGQGIDPFAFKLTNVTYGPSGKSPRMIWGLIDETKELIEFQRDLARRLKSLPFRIHQENRQFNPHLTLCRFNSFNLGHWQSDTSTLLSAGGLPDIETEIGERVEVRSIELMESKLKRGGAEYFVLQSVKL